VTVSHELSAVTPAVATISEENENLREELPDISSKLANLPHTQLQQTPPGIADLLASLRDLSHHVSAPIPAPLAPAPPPTKETPTPSNCRPPPFKERKGKGLCTSHTPLRRG